MGKSAVIYFLAVQCCRQRKASGGGGISRKWGGAKVVQIFAYKNSTSTVTNYVQI